MIKKMFLSSHAAFTWNIIKWNLRKQRADNDKDRGEVFFFWNFTIRPTTCDNIKPLRVDIVTMYCMVKRDLSTNPNSLFYHNSWPFAIL